MGNVEHVQLNLLNEISCVTIVGKIWGWYDFDNEMFEQINQLVYEIRQDKLLSRRKFEKLSLKCNLF